MKIEIPKNIMTNYSYDFLIVGAGLYGATIARLLTDLGYNCLIIDKRAHVAGNIYTENICGYDKHVYGPHIFHTNDAYIIDFVNKYSAWYNYRQNTIATDGNCLYSLPFNMNTYYNVFSVITPEEAYSIIEDEKRKYGVDNPTNLEEQAISMVGKTIYEKLIKNYTEKQWGKKCTELSPDIIKRLPLRFHFDNNYFNDRFQAIPKNGYTKFVENIIGNIPIVFNTEFTYNDYDYWRTKIRFNIIFCGPVDELLNYKFGALEWRSLKFVDKTFEYNGHNGQGTAIINNVSKEPYTRCCEHMWFTPNKIIKGITSIQTYEFPDTWYRTKERFYSINNAHTEELYNKYVQELYKEMPKIMLGGRLGKYKYFDMDDTIAEAFKDANNINLLNTI